MILVTLFKIIKVFTNIELYIFRTKQPVPKSTFELWTEMMRKSSTLRKQRKQMFFQSSSIFIFSGTITTAKEFDREHTDLYTLQIEARSTAPDQSLYWTLLQVAITVSIF